MDSQNSWLNNRWLGPIAIILILLLGGFATIAAPRIISAVSGAGGGAVTGGSHIDIPEPPTKMETVEIGIEDYIIGEELIKIGALAAQDGKVYDSIPVLVANTILFTIAIFLFAGPISLFVMFGQRFTLAQGSDAAVKDQRAALATSIKDFDKAKNKEYPPTPKPSHERLTREAWATGMMVVFLAYMGGYVIGEGTSSGSGGTVANIFAITAIILSWYFFRPQNLVAVEATSNSTKINWGFLWVALSGALMMGIGVGLMYVVMSGENPFQLILWEPYPTWNAERWQEIIEPLVTW